MKNNVFIGLGTNLGNKKQNLKQAISHIKNTIGQVLNVSSLYKTEAWGKTNQDNFLNQVIEIETELDAFEILKQCLRIETALGRVRKEKWKERLIDIDILYFNHNVIETESLTVPHPFLHERNFVLIPLIEINKDFSHPTLKKTNKELLEKCDDTLEVVKML